MTDDERHEDFSDDNAAIDDDPRPWAVGEVNPRTDDEHVPTFQFPTLAEAEEFLNSLPGVPSGRYYLEPVGRLRSAEL